MSPEDCRVSPHVLDTVEGNTVPASYALDPGEGLAHVKELASCVNENYGTVLKYIAHIHSSPEDLIISSVLLGLLRFMIYSSKQNAKHSLAGRWLSTSSAISWSSSSCG